MKYVLGTVQFGMNYGINNSEGKPTEKVVKKILDEAYQMGVRDLDSADFYGDALDVLGTYKNSGGHSFNIISKCVISSPSETFSGNLSLCLKRLKISSIGAYMFHRPKDYRAYKNLKLETDDIKKHGLIQKAGVSLYSLEDLAIAAVDPAIDIIQLPFNLLDSSLTKVNLMQVAKRNNKEIHIRSAFLQGLFFKSAESLTGNMTSLGSALSQLHAIQKSSGFQMRDLALGYINSFDCIDAIVFGVDNVSQLTENLKPNLQSLPESLIKEIANISLSNSSLLDPSKWQP